MVKKSILVPLILSIMLGNISIVSASTEENNNSAVITINKDSKTNQVHNVYQKIADELGINIKYIKTVHLLAGGKLLYADKNPDVTKDLTVESMKGSFEIDGVIQVYDKIASFVSDVSGEIKRPNKYYFPDAVYNVMSTIKDIMTTREQYTRDEYYNNLKAEAKTNVIFYESILEYTGNRECADKVLDIYKYIEQNKVAGEYVVEVDSNGNYSLTECYKNKALELGFSDKAINVLATAFSYDALLVSSDISVIKLTDRMYEIGTKRREDMFKAAFSLVGKVRYVWGGGHSGRILGINPIWQVFNSKYTSNRSIRPGNVWCPVHGENSCEGRAVSSLEEYLADKQGVFTEDEIQLIREKNVINFDELGEVGSHTLDGLDCSGFISWVFNQIDTSRVYCSTARNFIKESNIDFVEMGAQLLPGDILGWDTHICMIVGSIDDTNNTYIQIEQTPNVLRFGVAYYDGATDAQISRAKDIAYMANKWLGNVDESEKPNSKRIEKLNGIQIGRFNGFTDTSEIIDDKPLVDMKAQEIISYIGRCLVEWK